MNLLEVERLAGEVARALEEAVGSVRRSKTLLRVGMATKVRPRGVILRFPGVTGIVAGTLAGGIAAENGGLLDAVREGAGFTGSAAGTGFRRLAVDLERGIRLLSMGSAGLTGLDALLRLGIVGFTVSAMLRIDRVRVSLDSGAFGTAGFVSVVARGRDQVLETPGIR
jgi:hypothetical protein